MSWKSIVTAGVLCVVASPVFAVPQLSVSNGGLDASGNWIWNVMITPTAAGTPLAAELGFRESVAATELLGATKNATTWDTDNPGTQIFNWEMLEDVDPGAGTNMRPVGLQTNAATDEVFSALGSLDLAAGTAVQYITITTSGPTTTAPTTTIDVLGKYGAGGTNGRIAEITTGTNSTNYNNFSGSATRTAFQGDVNLSGGVTIADLNSLATNFGKAGNFHWGQGDLNGTTGGTGEVSIADLNLLAANFGKNGGTNTPLTVMGTTPGAAAALGGGSSVPEPASIALIGLAVLAGLGFTMRKR
jgi:hypothetical protein